MRLMDELQLGSQLMDALRTGKNVTYCDQAISLNKEGEICYTLSGKLLQLTKDTFDLDNYEIKEWEYVDNPVILDDDDSCYYVYTPDRSIKKPLSEAIDHKDFVGYVWDNGSLSFSSWGISNDKQAIIRRCKAVRFRRADD